MRVWMHDFVDFLLGLARSRYKANAVSNGMIESTVVRARGWGVVPARGLASARELRP